MHASEYYGEMLEVLTHEAFHHEGVDTSVQCWFLPKTSSYVSVLQLNHQKIVLPKSAVQRQLS